MFDELGTPKSHGWKWSSYFTYFTKLMIFTIFTPGWPRARLIARPPVDRSGRNFTWWTGYGMATDDWYFFDVHWRMRAQRLKKHKKPMIFISFFRVFQPLLPRTSTHINEISIICCHTLDHSPRKILARSAHRGPSNQLRPLSTRV